MCDPISDLLTRLRNASRGKQRFVDIEWSKIKEAIVKVLKEKGFVAHYLVKEEKKKSVMRIFLKFANGQEPILNQLIRISKPSRRIYVPFNRIPSGDAGVRGGIGISIVSTSQGVLEGSEAREKRVGGELLCLVY